MKLHLGTATVDITPRTKVALAGFAVRDNSRQGVRAPLSAQAFAFGSAPDRPDALLICADLLWWGPDLVSELRPRIATATGLSESAVVLHASHSHSAPTPGRTHSPLLGTSDEDYLVDLCDRTVDLAVRAARTLQPVSVSRGSATSTIGVNRRRLHPDGGVGGADPDGVTDPETTVVRFATEDGATAAVLVHYACHPVVSNHDMVGPDFPGAMRARLASTVDGVVGFLQGCCGDINPDTVRDGLFVRGDDADIDAIGHALADSALTALNGQMSALKPTAVRVDEQSVALALRPPSLDDLRRLRDQPGIDGDWSSTLLASPEKIVSEIPLRLTLLTIADGLALLGLDAEVTVAYGLFAKEYSAGAVLPMPYTNGMIGYVVTDEQLREGGYEPEVSYLYIYRPGPFAPGVEQSTKNAMADLMR